MWSLLDALQVDEATASTDTKKDARGEPPSKRVKRAVREHQQRLQQLCADRRDGRKTSSNVGARALRATACVTVLNTCHLLETFRQRHLGASFFIRFLFLIFCL